MSTAKRPKLVVVGDGGVGKTSIIVRYTRDQFSQGYEPTLADNYLANIELAGGGTMQVDIADTAGQEDYKPLRDRFMAEGDVFLVVYSITESSSLEMADELLEQISVLRENEPIKFVLAGNKCDLDAARQVSKTDAKAVADRYKGIFIETSAMNKTGITEAFQEIGRLLSQKDGKKSGGKSDGGSTGCCNVA